MASSRKYADDYCIETQKTKDGKRERRVAVYKGKYYEQPLEKRELLIHRLYITALAAVGMLIFCGVGLSMSPMMMINELSWYVIIAFVLTVLPVMMCIGKSGMSLFLPKKMERAQFERYVRNLKLFMYAAAISALVCGVLSVIYIISSAAFNPLDGDVANAFFAMAAVYFMGGDRTGGVPAKIY